MKRVFLVIILIVFGINSTRENPVIIYNNPKKTKVTINVKVKSVTLKYELIDTVINFIKSHEGFSASPYKDTNGYLTIGYGCIVDSSWINKTITPDQATNLLKRRLKKSINYVNHNFTGLSENQQIALAHLVYAKGIGSLLKHKISNKISSKQFDSQFFNSWLNWGKYEKIYPKYKLNRQFEIWLFNHK